MTDRENVQRSGKEGHRGQFARGVFEAIWIPAAFAVLGLSWAQVVTQAHGTDSGYDSGTLEMRVLEHPTLWLIDGFNAIQRTLLGGRERAEWWTAPRRAELMERAASFDDPSAEIWVVFDGPSPVQHEGEPEGPRQVFARSADEWLVERIRDSDDPSQIAVVTADRRLASRARRRGAQIVSPSAFLERCCG
jgi:hypothetical protein